MNWRIPSLLAVLLITAVLYLPTLHAPFLFDDLPNLAALSSIAHVDSWRDLGIYLSQPRGFPGRPLAMLSFLLQKADWPGHPLPFHLVNLGLHLANGLLVYLLMLRVARAWMPQAPSGKPRIWLPATLTTAIWLIAPVQLAGVTLVVQRMNLLMALFLLLGLLAYLRGLLDEQATSRSRGAWMLLGLGVCMGLSFLSKENGILLPLYALVLDATVLRAHVARLPKALAWWRRVLIWPVVLFVFGYLLWMVPAQWGLDAGRNFTVGGRLLSEPRVLLDYLQKIFLPRFGVYGLYHDGYVVSRGLLSPWSTLPALALVLGLGVTALLKHRRWPLFALAVLWYLGGQLLESSSVMLELYFEHRNYTPLIGIMLALALALMRMAPGSRRRLVTGLLALWLVACGITTALSARVYTSQDALALTWASAQPNSVRAQTYLADRLVKHGQLGKAMTVITTLAHKDPENAMLAEYRVYLLCLKGELKPTDIHRLEAALAHAPFDRGGFQNIEALRKLAFGGSCPALNPQSWLQLTDTLLANPAYARDGIASGFLHYQKHEWAVHQGDLGMAIHELKMANRTDPNAEIPRLEAKYLVSAGLYDQAIATLRHADYRHLPLLRRLLVNDRAINAADIARIEAMQRKTVQAREQKPAIPAAASSTH